MSYKIIGDSCTDLPSYLENDKNIICIPLTIHVGEDTIIDDETFNQKELIDKMAKSKECPRSSCPSPQAYMDEFSSVEDIYIITLSSKLSGSYNSAELAKKLYIEKHPNKNIAVIDSQSASVGQALIAMKIKELISQGKAFVEIEKLIYRFRDSLKTKFVLESLDNLRKNGRLNNLTAVICSALNIKPVMGATEGTIIKLDQARGIERALLKMVKYIEEDVKDCKTKILGIAHCNNLERAEFVKEAIMKILPFKDCFITNTKGISTLYASDGGIIVAY